VEPPPVKEDPVEKMQKLIAFNTEGGEDDIGHQRPIYRFTPRRDIIRRLIIRVTFAKGPGDFVL